MDTAITFLQQTATIPTTMLGFAQLCGRLAPIAAIGVFCAPLPTIRGVVADRSVGSLPLAPYSSILASTFVWVVYGTMRQEPKVWTANSVGFVLGLYYWAEFVRFSPKKSPTLPGTNTENVAGSR